jgi:lipoprotein NlpI
VPAGQNDQQEFKRNLDRVDQKTWPGPLAGVLVGELTPEKVGDIAVSADGQKTPLERRCDAQVYLGLLQLAVGDKREAEKLFRRGGLPAWWRLRDRAGGRQDGIEVSR